MNVEIPKGDFETKGPCWIPIVDTEGKRCRPIIVCQCGYRNSCSAHHIHADGTVTASYFHAAEPILSQGWAGGGCGWHVFLKLKDYDQGDFPPSA